MLKGKKAGFTDLFIFMIISFVLVVILGVFIYITNASTDELRENFEDMDLAGDGRGNNASAVLDYTLGPTVTSFNSLYWITSFLIFSMIIAIFIGSYMVTTKPIFFIPYIIFTFIAVVVAVVISNAYETIALDPTLNSTFLKFVGANWVLAKLPIVVSIVGIAGGIIMFVRMGKREEGYFGQ